MSRRFARPAASFLGMAFLLCSCTPPSAVNNQLRQENAQLKEQVTSLENQRSLDQRTLEKLQTERGTLPTLPRERLSQLYVAVGLQFGHLTGGSDLDKPGPGDHGLKVAVVPTDQDGDPLKAAGRFDIDAFDLALGNDARIGHWSFDEAQARRCWINMLTLYAYVFDCPWQSVPLHRQITVRVTFFDELTQTALPPVQKVVNVNLPPATQP